MEKEKDIKNEDKIEYVEKVSFSDVGRILLSPEQKENQKDEISQYSDITPEVKKLLLDSLKKVDEMVKPTTGGNARKTKGLTISAEKNKQHLKENPVQLDTKYEIDERTGEVLKKKSKIIRPVREDDEELSK